MGKQVDGIVHQGGLCLKGEPRSKKWVVCFRMFKRKHNLDEMISFLVFVPKLEPALKLKDSKSPKLSHVFVYN